MPAFRPQSSVPGTRGLSLAAVVFFLAALIGFADLLGVVLAAAGVAPTLRASPWIVIAYVAGLGAALYGAVQLTRRHPAMPWLMAGLTLFITVRLVQAPAGESPFYPAARIWLQRLALVAPMVASSVYLFASRGPSRPR